MESDRGFAGLVEDLCSPDKDIAIQAAHQLGDLGNSEAVSPLLQALAATGDHGLRDAAAVALRELRDPRAVPVLVSLLRDPKTEGYRGTLVHALQTLNPVEQLPFLVELVATGNWEVSHEAMIAIEDIEGVVPSSIWNDCVRKINDARRTATGDNADLLKDLSEMFTNEVEN